MNEITESQRPSPDALLAEAQRETRGKLKIFLGMAPGVGKTFEMLVSGKVRQREGVDVVIGVVESHGRRDTESLTGGFEIVPRKVIPYRGRELTEMDLDAVLARRPQLVLVDELAHTNAPGSRHPKRYMDVEEILSAGIDVYSTLNIQHLESLNDVVAQITRVRVRETLPDAVLDKADAIEVIDLTPEELIQRLREGKVYVPEQAERALKHFFSTSNLAALRELALRRAAQSVDAQMLDYLRAHAIAGPWAAGERVAVCINEHASSGALVRRTKRLADALKAPWTALYVESARHAQLAEAERNRVAETLRLAEQLGGRSAIIPGEDIVETLLAFSRDNRITQLVLGKSRRSRLFELINGSIVDAVVRKGGEIGVHVLPSTEGQTEPDHAPQRNRSATRSPDPLAYGLAVVWVGLSLGIALFLSRYAGLDNPAAVFLVPVLVTAASAGFYPGLLAALLGTLSYNYFFTEPLYTFIVGAPENVLHLIVFTGAAVITSHLTSRVRSQAQAALARAKKTAQLYSFSSKLAATADLDDVLWASSAQIAQMLKVSVVVLLPREGRLAVIAGFPPEDELAPGDLAAAQWAWDKGRPAGRDNDTLPGAAWSFTPIRTDRGAMAVVGVTREDTGPLFEPEERRLFDALLDQTAVAIERCKLAEEMDEVRVLAASEKLRSALLNAISHDLRTPLASIIGAISSLKAYWPRFSETERDDLIATVQEEAERMNRFVGNLLDMTRLEGGALILRHEPVDLREAAEAAVKATRNMTRGQTVQVSGGADLPLVSLDPALLERVLVNLIENAAKYANPKAPIRLELSREEDEAILRVTDEGPGISPDLADRVFERFFRIDATDRGPAGAGLGLAIARGFTEAMGGRISVTNRPDRSGAQFTLRFPFPLATISAHQ